MIKTRISILFLFLGLYNLAQDIHFSQFNDLPLALNPSLAGNMDGTVRTGTLYRNQWNTVSVPFESIALYADFKSAPQFLKNKNVIFSKKNRSEFLNNLEKLIQKIKKISNQ